MLKKKMTKIPFKDIHDEDEFWCGATFEKKAPIFPKIPHSILALLLLLLLQACKPGGEATLEEKINLAVQARQLPSAEKQSEIYAQPPWIEERSARQSERLRKLEAYLPTIGISKGDAKVTEAI